MVDDRLRYDRMVERALRDVVREALAQAAKTGLPGDHHFYLTFATDYPGVMIPKYLRRQYPEEMTIIIQYQFKDLVVEPDLFEVTLSFNHTEERLSIPLAAVTTFADPSVNFVLQFQALPVQEDGEAEPLAGASVGDDAAVPGGLPAPAEAAAEPSSDGSAKVITLDQFRKK
ncbi:MAG: hypothetical protein KDA49_09555 [Rhodospirillaceae bacterium]|nr:hypothetical protein [Rhodospirillaceae bacterium]MCA8932700.1 hypothetical protein [Rhodospirillaceae bacterium]